jgi:uncharacterized tellurite resistance protein B-like protein
MNFKKIISVAVFSMMIGNVYGMQCGYVDGKLRPSDEEAKKLASHLKVSTCDGPNFKMAVTALGKKVVEATLNDAQAKKIRTELDQAKKEKLIKKLKRKGYVVK